jgi:hypothetical protein
MNLLHLFGKARLETADGCGIEVVLRADHPLRLANARGRRIRCTAGCAWITAPGLCDDIFLHGGEAWEITSDGVVLIEAVGKATVALAAAAADPYA